MSLVCCSVYPCVVGVAPRPPRPPRPPSPPLVRVVPRRAERAGPAGNVGQRRVESVPYVLAIRLCQFCRPTLALVCEPKPRQRLIRSRSPSSRRPAAGSPARPPDTYTAWYPSHGERKKEKKEKKEKKARFGEVVAIISVIFFRSNRSHWAQVKHLMHVELSFESWTDGARQVKTLVDGLDRWGGALRVASGRHLSYRRRLDESRRRHQSPGRAGPTRPCEREGGCRRVSLGRGHHSRHIPRPASRGISFIGCGAVELGAGVGLLSTLLCKLGARKVYATDLAKVLPLLQENADANGFAGDVLEVMELEWGCGHGSPRARRSSERELRGQARLGRARRTRIWSSRVT